MSETKTTVVNVRSRAWAEAVKAGTAVYVGRTCAGFKGSPFGNPWKVGGKIARGEAVHLYREWAAGTREHPKGKPFPDHLLETLRGKVLGCWCHPQSCHADVLVGLLEAAHAR